VPHAIASPRCPHRGLREEQPSSVGFEDGCQPDQLTLRDCTLGLLAGGRLNKEQSACGCYKRMTTCVITLTPAVPLQRSYHTKSYPGPDLRTSSLHLRSSKGYLVHIATQACFQPVTMKAEPTQLFKARTRANKLTRCQALQGCGRRHNGASLSKQPLATSVLMTTLLYC
jgi:hypothetical protein